MADTAPRNLTDLTVDLLSAYVASNTVDSAELAGLVRSTHAALRDLEQGSAGPTEPVEPVAAVSVRKSLASPDHLLSLIDGKPYKTLKRHLASHGLTPADYRSRFKLPGDYPMVSKAYSETRRLVANRVGLGRTVKGPVAPSAPVTAPPAAVPTPRRAPLKLRLSGAAPKIDR